MTNVTQIAKYGLCCGCGTCAGMCPSDAIKMTITHEGIYVPTVEGHKCANCHVCINSCPGHSVDFKRHNLEIFGKQHNNNQVGNYLECYVGHSNNPDIQYNSASGGLATQLLIFALEEGMINGALITRMKKCNPTEPEPFIARTREEIIEASKSKYCPVAVNVGLREILKEPGRFAVVGLPCHIHGLRKAEGISTALNNKIVLHIGLLCSHMTSFSGIEFLLRKLRIKASDVTKIDYRGTGWPGSMTVHLKGGSVKSIPLFGNWRAYWPIFSSFFFTPVRCTMCPDQSAELSDISLGDAWLPEFKNEKSGKSIIIARTERGKNLLRLANAANSISIRPVSAKKIEQSQAINLIFKKKDLPTRLLFAGLLGKQTPQFSLEMRRLPSPASSIRSAFVYCNMKASNTKSIEAMLTHVPFPLFRTYYGIYKFLSYI